MNFRLMPRRRRHYHGGDVVEQLRSNCEGSAYSIDRTQDIHGIKHFRLRNRLNGERFLLSEEGVRLRLAQQAPSRARE